jgi:hypothetical protein
MVGRKTEEELITGKMKVRIYIFIFIALFAVRFWISTLSYNNDMHIYFSWVNSLKTEGFAGFFERDFSPYPPANYPPLIMSSFYFSDLAAQKLGISNDKVIGAFYKLPVVFVETAAILLLAFILGPLIGLILLINPAIFYNSLLWGQTEGLVASLIVFCLYFLFKKKVFVSAVFFSAALLVKPSAIIFAPVILIAMCKQFNFKKAILGIVLSIAIFATSFIPFVGSKFFTFSISFLSSTSAGQEHQWQASVNALNFWFVAGLNKVSDSGLFFFLSYRIIGIILAGAVIILILYLFSMRPITFKSSLIAAGLINFAACLFMTRVHERHLMPTLILLVPLALLSVRNFIAYVSVSLIHFLNVYLIWHEQFASSNIIALKILSLLMVAIFIYFVLSEYWDVLLNKPKLLKARLRPSLR